MKTILLLTDFSSVADNAAKYALKLGQALKAKIILFHAYAVPQRSVLAGAEDYFEEDGGEPLHRELVLRLEGIKRKLNLSMSQEDAFKPPIGSFLLNESLKDSLPNIIKEFKVNLVITGAHKSNAVSSFLFGDQVMGIIDNATCPVLIIPEYSVFQTIKNIFYATDIRYCDIPAVKILTKLATSTRSVISMLHICAPGLPEMLDNEAASLFTDTISARVKYPLIGYNSIKAKDAEMAINNFIAKRQMDILAIELKKYHFFRRLFKGGLTEKTSTYMRIPLLVIPVS